MGQNGKIESEIWHYQTYQGGWCGVYNSASERIASVNDEPHARLVAAAPEMLRTLQAVKAFLAEPQADDTAILTQVANALRMVGHVQG